MATPPWHAVTSGTTTGTAGDINQFLGTHPASYARQGTSQVSYTVAATTSSNTNTGSAAQWLAQPFLTAVGQTTISRIELNMQLVSTGSDVTLELRTDNGGNPSNSAFYSILIPLDFLVTGSPTVLSIPCSVTGLTPTTKYHIVLDGTSSTSAYVAWNAAATSVNAGLTSSTGTSGWASAGHTFLFNVFAGTNGVLRNTSEDGSNPNVGSIFGINSLPPRWTGIDYTQASSQNSTPSTLREYVIGTVRKVTGLTYSSGALTQGS